MARLLEHHGKALLREAGIATPNGVLASSARDARAAAEGIGFPVALKAQVLAGKRGLAGGIAFADDAAQADAVAERLFATPVYGLPVRELLVEAKCAIEHELYVAVVSDTRARAPVMVVSTSGGMGIEEADPSTTVSAPVDVLNGAPVYWCLHLVGSLALTEPVRLELALICAALYTLYWRYDCTLAESTRWRSPRAA